MTGTTLAALLGAIALAVVGDGAARGRLRALGPRTPAEPSRTLRGRWTIVGGLAAAAPGWLVAGGPEAGTGAVAAAALLGGAVAAALHIAARWAVTAPRTRVDGLAAGWELLATCLESGLPVPTAVEVAAQRIEGPASATLRRVGGLLELGSDGAEAWTCTTAVPELAAFGRAARRSADTGAGLARVARGEAERLRAGLADAAEARAERAAVLVAAPLGLCFLPAFLALGIAPVVIGLAGRALSSW
ncbi:type II secretion system F family protein [Pseudonocardia xishanensis]|uniref:Type II secretion system protein GspF domain-containing protein n=1 Tax=Pseudonocardia xishanensis TaxID=630995 RepID=A0ABP8RNL5_9PSEU